MATNDLIFELTTFDITRMLVSPKVCVQKHSYKKVCYLLLAYLYGNPLKSHVNVVVLPHENVFLRTESLVFSCSVRMFLIEP